MEVITFIPCPTCGHQKDERMIYTKEELKQVLLAFNCAVEASKMLSEDIKTVDVDKIAEKFIVNLMEFENDKA
jgi:hypothetical protein